MRLLCVFVLLLAMAGGLAAQTLPAKRTAVAVMTLRGSGISEAEAKFLTERLVIELQRAGVFEVMERDRMEEILKEQGFQQTGACDETACLVEAGRLLPVEKMIGGSVGKVGNVYSAQIRLIDLMTGKLEKTATRDYRGELEHLLTVGMRESAEELSGQRAPQAQTAAASAQDQEALRRLLEAQYDSRKKSKGWAVFWSILLPGAGNYYAKNYVAGTVFLVGGLTLQFSWMAAAIGSDTSGTASATSSQKSTNASALGLLYLGVRVVDTFVATGSVERYNRKLRQKYGLTLQAVPYRDKVYATAAFDF